MSTSTFPTPAGLSKVASIPTSTNFFTCSRSCMRRCRVRTVELHLVAFCNPERSTVLRLIFTNFNGVYSFVMSCCTISIITTSSAMISFKNYWIQCKAHPRSWISIFVLIDLLTLLSSQANATAFYSCIPNTFTANHNITTGSSATRVVSLFNAKNSKHTEQ